MGGIGEVVDNALSGTDTAIAIEGLFAQGGRIVANPEADTEVVGHACAHVVDDQLIVGTIVVGRVDEAEGGLEVGDGGYAGNGT